MCFSAEASFTASAVLGIVGIALLKQTKKRSLLLLASFPLLFALQQFSEGILWTYLPSEETTSITTVAKFTFMAFAYMIWPIYVPLSLLLPEVNPQRRKIIEIALLCGTFFSFTFLFLEVAGLITTEVNLIGYSVRFTSDYLYFQLFYLLVLFIPFFISSLKGMKMYGFSIVGAFLFTQLFFSLYSISVWCFFSALISLSMFFILRRNG